MQVKKAIEKGNIDGAKIYAQNAIRKKTEALNYLRLASRLDAVVSRLDTQAKMNMINSSMSQIVRSLDRVSLPLTGLPWTLFLYMSSHISEHSWMICGRSSPLLYCRLYTNVGVMMPTDKILLTGMVKLVIGRLKKDSFSQSQTSGQPGVVARDAE